MPSILAFDPGHATGIAFGTFTDTTPLVVDDAEILPYDLLINGGINILAQSEKPDYVVSEKFSLRSGNEFTADLSAVKVEGLLELVYGSDNINWRDPSTKSQVPDDILKDHGVWRTGDDVEWEDGRDANDAIIHLIGFVAFQLKHKPTLEVYFR